MQRHLRFKFLFIVAVVLVCIYGIIGLPKNKTELADNWHHNIHLGLDLRGGSYLVVQVQEQDAFNNEASARADSLKEQLQKANIPYSDVAVGEAHSLQDATKASIIVKGVPATQAGAFRTIANEQFNAWLVTPTSGTDYKLTMKPTDALKLWQDVLSQTKNTMDKKINALGLTEASVQQRREDSDAQLLIQMPDVDDPGHVKQILQTAAVLDLYDVRGGPFASRDEALAQNGGILPPGTKLIGKATGTGTQDSHGGGGIYLVSRTPVVRGSDIRDSSPQQGQMPGEWDSRFVLSQDAGRRFSAYTGSHIGQRLAIVLDGSVIEAPVIKGQIGDEGVIEGQGSEQNAADLALNLKAGSLPAGIIFLQENTVGPSLGADSIRHGFLSGIAGVLAVIVAMLIYYKRSGINAVLALILNAVILIACLSYFDAVLTLPGIAGFILTIGMAVDSNVLIFERIREELHNGKAIIPAVDAGFSKALLTIIDTHVTTVVSCAILFMFGSGPVKGFAVTLVIGLVANIFTAVFVSKVIFDWELSRPVPVRELSI
jgi:preprotein translocase subunit SecD